MSMELEYDGHVSVAKISLDGVEPQERRPKTEAAY